MKTRKIKKLIQRTQKRIKIAAGAWHAASRTKKTVRWLMSLPGDADQNNEYELPELRYKSGELIRNFPIAASIQNRKRHSVIGPGIKVQPDIDYEYLGISKEQADIINKKLRSKFRGWAEPLGVCDIERQVNFSGYQRLLLDSRLERGDVFTLLVGKKRPGCPYTLRLQMIEADQVSNPSGKPDSSTLRDGVERDKDGELLGIWYQTAHPGNTTSAGSRKWEYIPFFSRVGERQLIQFIDKRRRGQSRGVPDLTPVIEALAQLTKFSEAYLHKAVISAFFTLLYKGDDSENSPLDGIGESQGSTSVNSNLNKMGTGTAIEIGQEEDVQVVESKTPNSEYGPYYESVLKAIAAAVNVPPEILMLLFSTSYTAAQAAFQEYWRYVETERDLLYQQLREIYIAWFNDAIRLGIIDFLPKYDNISNYDLQQAYTRCTFVAPPKGHLRPKEQNVADGLAEDRGWKTPEQNAAERGNDYHKPPEESTQ